MTEATIGGDWEEVAAQSKKLVDVDNPGEGRVQDAFGRWDAGEMNSLYQARVSQTLRRARESSKLTLEFAEYLASMMLLRISEADEVDVQAHDEIRALMAELQAHELALDGVVNPSVPKSSGGGVYGSTGGDAGGNTGGGTGGKPVDDGPGGDGG